VPRARRAFDIVSAATGLCLLLPLMVLIALLVACTDGLPVLYREHRVGHGGRLFPLCKFRTLRTGSAGDRSVAPEDDPRISRVGRWLRRWRLDELPQLLNVLRGDMSIVGPRPMPTLHAAALPAEQRDIILSVRPGVTDPAAIRFLAEDAVLVGHPDAERLYLECLLPVKARLQIESLQNRSLAGDLKVVLRTLALLWSPRAREISAAELRGLLEAGSPQA